jgi:hypothetical protein
MKKKVFSLLLSFSICLVLFTTCDYGNVGGADKTFTYTAAADIAQIIDPWRGVWYSHYGALRLDGYRIGKWSDRAALLPPAKQALFPGFDIDNPTFRSVPASIGNDDYFICYDDTVYGQTGEGTGGNARWGFGYMGIVWAVIVFQSVNSGAGAVIIEYLDGCYPQWEPDLPGPLPLSFFGIYYRIVTPDVIQMANAVEMANLAAGKKYYTETATLQEAIDKNKAENDGEFIAWGVVYPQDRE